MSLPVFDGHCDTAVELYRRNMSLRENTLSVSLRRAEKLKGYAQFFAFCTVWMQDELSAEERYSRFRSAFVKQIEANADRVTLCRSASDAESAVAANKAAAFLSIEGGEAIGCDPDRLEAAKKQGISMISLTWNHENALCGSCLTGSGLTDRGREFCRTAQQLGIVLDVSHLSDRGFFELCEISAKPIVASHSDSRSVCAHPRNLTDEQFLTLCQLNGAAGINLYSRFLREDGAAGIDDVYRHIDRFLELGGDGHVCLGADFDGCDTTPEGLGGIDDYVNLEEYLRQRGYSEKTLYDLFFGTWMRVIRECVM